MGLSLTKIYTFYGHLVYKNRYPKNTGLCPLKTALSEVISLVMRSSLLKLCNLFVYQFILCTAIVRLWTREKLPFPRPCVGLRTGC